MARSDGPRAQASDRPQNSSDLRRAGKPSRTFRQRAGLSVLRRCRMRRCNLCGSTNNVTKHHVGGQNFIAWFTMGLCARCQEIFHARQRAAGIDLRCTPSPMRRLIRALKMCVLFMWMLLDMFEREIDQEPDEAEALSASSRGGTK